MQGTERNKRFAPLFFDTANILGPKIGRADEWRQFRKFFNPSAYPGDDAAGDPDRQKWEGGPDQDINPDRKDNYVVAGDWSVQANAVEERYGQTGLMRLLFRQSPSKYLLDYAEARQREGSFDEITQFAWEEAFRAWTEDFGRERFAVYDPYQKRSVDIQLEATEEDIASMAADQGVKADLVRKWTANMQNICNYRYWRTRALAEKEQETVSAHREIYDGQQLFKSAQTEEALKLLDSGMTRFQEMLNRHPQLSQEDSTIEEALMSILYWQASHVLLERQPPADFPLKALWEKEQGRLPQIQKQFRTETSIN